MHVSAEEQMRAGESYAAPLPSPAAPTPHLPTVSRLGLLSCQARCNKPGKN